MSTPAQRHLFTGPVIEVPSNQPCFTPWSDGRQCSIFNTLFADTVLFHVRTSIQSLHNQMSVLLFSDAARH